VEVEIDVNTSPFDSSIENCNNHVNGLTASVGVMNAAQCAAIASNADKISKTIVDGFFQSVRTDLSTQKAELEQKVESKLLLLRQQAETLREKQKTMTVDYTRTSARYQKLFEDLNNELSIRIHEVDQPVFSFVKDVESQSDRMLHTDMVQTAVTMSKESSLLQAQLSAATVKHHALEAMNKAQDFLISKANTEKTIQKTCLEENDGGKYLIPVCYMRTESENKHEEHQCYIPDYYTSKNPGIKKKLCEKLENTELVGKNDIFSEQLRSYLASEIDDKITGDDTHSLRVKEMIKKLFNK
jgi:hypothetical protein